MIDRLGKLLVQAVITTVTIIGVWILLDYAVAYIQNLSLPPSEATLEPTRGRCCCCSHPNQTTEKQMHDYNELRELIADGMKKIMATKTETVADEEVKARAIKACAEAIKALEGLAVQATSVS